MIAPIASPSTPRVRRMRAALPLRRTFRRSTRRRFRPGAGRGTRWVCSETQSRQATRLYTAAISAAAGTTQSTAACWIPSASFTPSGRRTRPTFPRSFPFRASNAGGYDGMLLKINFNSALVFNTYFGGTGDDSGRAIALHATQLTPYVTGYTWSTNFPILNPAQPLNAGGQDAFVARFNSDGNALVFSTYLGGSNGTTILPEQALAIAVDPLATPMWRGHLLVEFPDGCRPSKHQPGRSGCILHQARQWRPACLQQLSRRHGDRRGDRARGRRKPADLRRRVHFVREFSNRVAVTGRVGGSYDAFMTQVNVNGTPLIYSSYLGGTAADQAYGVAINVPGRDVPDRIDQFVELSRPVGLSIHARRLAGHVSVEADGRGGASGGARLLFALARIPASATSAVVHAQVHGRQWREQLRLDPVHGELDSVGSELLPRRLQPHAGACLSAQQRGDAWTGGFPPGALNTLSNSQCALPLANMTGVHDRQRDLA